MITTINNNRGLRPQQAALRASTVFNSYLYDNSEECDTLEDIGHHLLLAASAAHNAIIEGNSPSPSPSPSTPLSVDIT